MKRAGRSALFVFVPAVALGWVAAFESPSLAAKPPAATAPVASSPAASSQAKAAAKPADKRAAQKLLAQGNQLLGEGDYLGALEKFRSAYDKFPSPKLLLNIGTTLRQLGRNVEAAEIYEKYLSDPERDASREKEVKRVLDEIDAVVGRIVITADEPLVTVRLDGKALDGFVSGQSRRIDTGEHTVIGDKPGAQPVVQTVMVRARQEHHILLRFLPPPPPPKPPPPPDPNTGVQRKLGLAMGGLGLVSILGGAVLGGVALSQSDAAKQHCFQGGKACDKKGVDLDQSAKTSATISTVGFSVGAGVLAVGAVIWLLAPSAPKERAASGPGPRWLGVAPQAGGATVGFGGVF